MIPIKLGTNRYGAPIHYWEPLSYNVIIVVAKPRYGKSVLVKNIFSQIAQYRRVLIFDYQDEHSGTMWGNWKSEDKVCFIPDLVTVKDFGFYLSDFDKTQDWVSFGFNEKSAFLLKKILDCPTLHKESPQRVLEIIQELPVKTDDVAPFNEKFGDFGLTFPVRVHASTQVSLLTSFDHAYQDGKGIIMPHEGTAEYEQKCAGRTYISDWGKFITENRHVNVNLDIRSSNDVGRARAGVGKILDKLTAVLPILNPLIVVEEADFVCPRVEEGKVITSLFHLQQYTLKHQRTGVEVLFITQNPYKLDGSVVSSGTVFIMGQHTPCDEMRDALNEPHLDYQKDVIHKLKANRFKNEREFALMLSGNGGRYDIFEVDDSYTLLK